MGVAKPGAIEKICRKASRDYSAGRLEKARLGFKKMLRVSPGNTLALYNLGMIAHHTNDNHAAIQYMLEAQANVQSRTQLTAIFYCNLGAMFIAVNDSDQALDALGKALSMDPGLAIAHNNMGNVLSLKDRLEDAVVAYNSAIRLDPKFTDAYVNLGGILMKLDRIKAATTCYKRAAALNPDHPTAGHLYASLSGKDLDTASHAYVRKLFDDYSENFEKSLVGTLEYSMPVMLREVFDSIEERPQVFTNMIDLGCGTGLVGKAFSAIAERMTGIDLSSQMIEKAGEIGLYDQLLVGSIDEEFEKLQTSYDLIICADVFPYIGNLNRIFLIASRHCVSEGYFAFSTERSDEVSEYMLQSTGRFVHSSQYIKTLCDNHGFKLLVLKQVKLRKQADAWILGDLVVLQRLN